MSSEYFAVELIKRPMCEEMVTEAEWSDSCKLILGKNCMKKPHHYFKHDIRTNKTAVMNNN